MPLVLALLLSSDPVALFNGSDLAGWTGDDRFWGVEDGAIVGRTTADDAAERNTFLIYTGGPQSDGESTFGDFELTLEYQVSGFNSGVQYRSQRVAIDGPDRFSMTGYQADFEATWHDGGTVDKFSGMVFDEAGRMFLAQRGQAVLITPGESANKPSVTVLGTIGENQSLGQTIDRDGWNTYRIVADGHSLTHIINGQVMAMAIDEDTDGRHDAGLVGLQLHSGPPMEIRVRNITLRPLHE